MSRDQRLLCFATRFGDIHVIDLKTLEDIKIQPGGMDPAKELGKFGVLLLGGVVVTSAGRLPFKGIIQVAGIGRHRGSSEE